MNEEPQSPNAQPPADAAQAKPAYVGNSNIIDRSGMQNIYPAPGGAAGSTSSPAPDKPYDQASSAFAEAKVLVCGVASTTSYVLIVYLVKNLWITALVSAILALAAIFFAISDYGKSNKIGPLTIIGLSAATITLVYIANILMAEAMIHAYAPGYGF